ncbi:hypothetical protein [Peribacillus sp. SCS-155]|uniref:hypothetical protein n=1 Tax=Peribacillus sedimenti TaxID=3115297 RepID=UPI0039058A0A
MDRQRTLFYGFIIGFTLLISPIPSVLYWMDDIEEIYRYLGLIISCLCGIPLIIDAFKVLLKDVQEK